MAVDPDALLLAWFGKDFASPQSLAARARVWFSFDEKFDELIRREFSEVPDKAIRGDLSAWRKAPHSTLALVIALDQLPRNLYRGAPEAFAYDSAALDLSRWALARSVDAQLHPVQAAFLYLPLEHAEDAFLQGECVARFRALVERAPTVLRDQFESFLSYAERHQAVVNRFGRFPHRNQVLGRASTPEEKRYLEEGGETFGAEGAA